MVEKNSENNKKEDNNSKEVEVNVKKKGLMSRYFIIFNGYDLFL